MLAGEQDNTMVRKKRTPKTKRQSPTDIQERAVLMTALQEYLEQRPGTQAEKAGELGITQPRLNDLLKERIDKFSLDALVTLATKAGLRVKVNVQPIQLHSGLGTISSNRPPTLSIFAPAPSELSKLDSTLGTSVFLNLLRCEALANGLNPKDVVLSLNINVKDGGIDAKVDNSPTSSSLLAKGSTHFQIKTGPSFKPWQPSSLKKELFGKLNANNKLQETTRFNKKRIANTDQKHKTKMRRESLCYVSIVIPHFAGINVFCCGKPIFTYRLTENDVYHSHIRSPSLPCRTPLEIFISIIESSVVVIFVFVFRSS